MLSSSRKEYFHLYDAQAAPPLYAAPWWLDATCGPEGWDALQLKSNTGDGPYGFPFHKTRIRNLPAIINPWLTQWIPILKSEENLPASLREMMAALPAVSILDLSFKREISMEGAANQLPVVTRYSYIITPGGNLDSIRKRYNEGLRRNLREAEKTYTITSGDDLSSFLGLCSSSYKQRKLNSPAWLPSVIPSVYRSLRLHECGALDFAMHHGKPIASILTAWDQKATYYLAGGRTGDEAGASAHALLLDKALTGSVLQGREFDFEGSMHSGIANFFQSFGASPEEYWQVKKYRGMGKLWSLFH
ncbi:MAG: GNAT family N-acetyltransferase [Saprospiraceae bacterium]